MQLFGGDRYSKTNSDSIGSRESRKLRETNEAHDSAVASVCYEKAREDAWSHEYLIWIW
jgi:hypothetical protein